MAPERIQVRHEVIEVVKIDTVYRFNGVKKDVTLRGRNGLLYALDAMMNEIIIMGAKYIYLNPK
jgi:hypothetical protein